jgi:hypothetical protein
MERQTCQGGDARLLVLRDPPHDANFHAGAGS